MARSDRLVPFTAAFFSATLVLSSTASAQGVSHDYRSLTTAPRHATLDFTTGEVVRGDEKTTVPLVTIWANTGYSGYYGQPNAGEEWLDWGIITTTSGSDIVGEYTFAYATTALDSSVGGPGAPSASVPRRDWASCPTRSTASAASPARAPPAWRRDGSSR